MSTSRDLAAIIDASGYVEALFDRVPDVVFFVKDLDGRYAMVNTTLVTRCGVEDKKNLIGRTTAEVFPAPLGERFLEQDRAVATNSRPITQKLELHPYPNRREGWCLTDKLPLTDQLGRVVGIVGISRDVETSGDLEHGLGDLGRAVERIRASYADPPSVAALAREIGMSPYQLNRRLRLLFGITARQLLIKTRVDAASRLLRETNIAIGDVAQRSGYFDQSAFTRQFRRTTGLTPQQYRQRHRPHRD
jgi:AraC-like DNA-binding protein